MLTDRQIRAAVDSGELALYPFDLQRLQPVSYDLTLDAEVRVFDHRVALLDTKEIKPYTVGRTISEHGLWIQPGQFMLACTREVVGLPGDMAARVEGKSSLGRIGLAIHVTAGFIDPGFNGQITLELVNNLKVPIRLHAGMKIGQLCFFRLDEVPEQLYGQAGNHYQGQMGPTESRFRA